MTIDERLERLAERHKALSHTVELLAAEGKETGEQIRAMVILAEQNEVRAERNEERAVRTQAGNEKRFSEVARSLATVLDSLQRLERIATAHERDLTDMET
jgi:archaellum component FlaC